MKCYKCKEESEAVTTTKGFCLDCRRKSRKATQLKHAERSKERSAKWYQDNKERISLEAKERYKNDPDFRAKKDASNRKWDNANKDRIRIQSKEHRRINKVVLAEKAKLYRERKKQDPEYVEMTRRKGREYYANNKEACNARATKYNEENREYLNKKSVEWSRRNIEIVRERRNASVKAWNDNNPLKKKAQSKIQKQVQLKKIIKPDFCSVCGKEDDSRNIIAHHHDYSLPLDVVWCCRKCHGFIHRNLQLNNKSLI